MHGFYSNSSIIFHHAWLLQVTFNYWYKFCVHKPQFCMETVPPTFQHSIAAFDSAPC